MARFYVNRNRQSTGEYEVHERGTDCPRHADPENRIDLGWHDHCRDAVRAAERKGYTPADGCAYCAPECHKR